MAGWELVWPFRNAGSRERAWGGAAQALLGFVVCTLVCSLRRRDAETLGLAWESGGGLRDTRPWAPRRSRAGMGRARAAGLALPLLLWQLLALAGGGAAFYLEVRELEEKCFIQEIPDGTVVIGARAPPVPALPYPYPEPSEGMEDGARGISSGPREGTDGHGWETGGQLCGQSTLSIACAGVGDTEEARLIQIRVTAEKQGWRREERGRGLWPGPTIRPDLPVPPPTTTPVTKSPWWALGHDCG